MVAPFAEGIEVPLRPFFGSMGVAPPEASGRISSAPPGIHAGNLDNKELVAGTTLFIPVHVPGGPLPGRRRPRRPGGRRGRHHRPGNLADRRRSDSSCARARHLNWPRAETPTHFIAMGIDKDLDEAMKIAVREAVDLIVAEKKLDRDDAYMLCSVAVDFRVTQVVDGTKGVHAMIPKSIFKK